MELKKSFIFFSLLALLFILGLTFFVVSFFIVKPTTDRINRTLAERFEQLVRIPMIPAEAKNYNETVYFWEMETTQKEVVGVRFTHDTLFSKNQSAARASVELPENGDASIFVKVLPAVVSDEKSLNAAIDPQKASHEASPEAPYTKFQIFVKPETGQPVKINWELKKDQLTKDLEGDYKKLQAIPEPILELLYNFQKLTFDILAG